MRCYYCGQPLDDRAGIHGHCFSSDCVLECPECRDEARDDIRDDRAYEGTRDDR